MHDTDNTTFPHALIQKQAALFLVLLAVVLFCIARYPAWALALGRRAAERGHEDRAIRILEKVDTEEAQALLRSVQEQKTEKLIEEGVFEEALSLLSELSITDPADERVAACLYGQGCGKLSGGEYGVARELFLPIRGYRDAGDLQRRCEMALAFAAFEAGDSEAALAYARMNPQEEQMQSLETAVYLQRAQELLRSEDPEQGLALLYRLWQDGRDVEGELLAAQRSCHPDLYTDRSDEYILQQLRTMGAEEMEAHNRRLERAMSLPRNVIALGNEHTVLLKEDGTVTAAGDNSFGQCSVSDWTDVIAVAAGAYHTVGLKADGTLLAAGDDRYGQCDVDTIRGAVAVDAHGFDTAVLCDDGTIRCLGYHDYGLSAMDWKDVRGLSLGGYALLALTEGGIALSTEPSLLTDNFRDLIALDAAGTYTAGVTEGGEVVTTLPQPPDWEDVVAISASANGIMGLLTDGTVRFWLLQPGDYGTVTAQQGIVAIAFSGRHAAALREDGTLIVCGDDRSGQCDLSGIHR